MPTQPHSPIIDRDLSKAEAKEIIDVASPMLQEMVNYGSQLAARCIPPRQVSRSHFSILLAYMHTLEIVDAVEVLISNACNNSAVPLIRSAFEGMLALDYLIKEDTDRRARCYVFFHIRSQLIEHRQLDTSTTEGRQLQQAYQNDKWLRNFPFPSFPDLENAIKFYQSKMDDPKFQDIRNELDRTINQRGIKYPHWYTLFAGPKNVKELANHLGRSGEYASYYGMWSKISHAAPPHKRLTLLDEDDMYIKPIRNGEGSLNIVFHAARITLESTEAIITKLRPGEQRQFARWYATEIRSNFLEIAKRK